MASLFQYSLRLKIVGLISILLLIMLAITGYSHLKTLQGHDKIVDLNEIIIPVLSKLTNIEIQTLRQEVQFEQAIQHTLLSAELDIKNKDIAQIKELGEQIDKEILVAKTFIEKALKRVIIVDDAIELARIEPILRTILKEHQQFTQLSLSLLSNSAKEIIANKNNIYKIQLQQLDSQEKYLYETLNTLVVHLEDFVQQQAHHIKSQDDARLLLSWEILFIALSAFVIGTVLSLFSIQRILVPIQKLKINAQFVAKGILDIEMSPSSKDEVGELTIAFNYMVKGLQDRENIKKTFSSYVDPRIARHLMSSNNKDQAGDRRIMTVFFSDIEGFTSISEQLTPETLVKFINQYLSEMSIPIQDEEGVIDKFIGDAIMAYWGTPFVNDDTQAISACRAGLVSLQRLTSLQEQIPDIVGLRVGAPKINIRIGIATGPVLIGNIGSKKIRNYTIMGDTVNLAARLESASKTYGTVMLLNEETSRRVKDELLLREIDRIAVKGKEEPTRIFEPLGEMSSVSQLDQKLKEVFEQALLAYRAQQWEEASQLFTDCLSIKTNDAPSKVFLKRIQQLQNNPPSENWDGVFKMISK
jgi:adenylate cyclase